MGGDKNKDQASLSAGQRVVVLGKRKGTVRFCGSTDFGPGTLTHDSSDCTCLSAAPDLLVVVLVGSGLRISSLFDLLELYR
eukprot:3365755-Rhodomonas_salina.3